MDMGWIVPVGVVGAMSVSHAFKTWVRAKHGYPLENDHGGKHNRLSYRDGTGPNADRKVELLSTKNERLTGQVSRLEERIAVLERIATDPAERTAREIEALRDR